MIFDPYFIQNDLFVCFMESIFFFFDAMNHLRNTYYVFL